MYTRYKLKSYLEALYNDLSFVYTSDQVLAAAAFLLSPQSAIAKALPPDEGPLISAVADVAGAGVSGTVRFSERISKRGRKYTEVAVDLKGLKPGTHGINVHAEGGASCADVKCLGGSWNPDKLPHGKPDATKKASERSSDVVSPPC